MVQKVNLAMTGDVEAEVDAVAASVAALDNDLTTLDASLGTASTRDVGTGATDVVETSQLDVRLNTAGNLGTAAQKTVGTADGNLPEYQSVVVELGGNFIAGQQVKAVRIGDLVTITATSSTLDHTDALSAPTSAAGAIPAAYRPAAGEVIQVYAQDANAWAQVGVTSTGDFSVTYRDSAGSPTTRNTTIQVPNISYVI